jgi:hypothetical protein
MKIKDYVDRIAGVRSRVQDKTIMLEMIYIHNDETVKSRQLLCAFNDIQ